MLRRVGKVTLFLMCSPGWPQTRNPLASDNQVFGLWDFGSKLGSDPVFFSGSECGPAKAVFQEAFLIELLSCDVSKITVASSPSGPRRPFSKSLLNEACLFLSLNLLLFYAPAFLTLSPLRALPCSPSHFQSGPKDSIPSWEEWTPLPHRSSSDISGYVSELCRRMASLQPQPSLLCFYHSAC